MRVELTPKQSQVFTNKARTCLAGGSAGGGKSLLIRALAIQFCLAVPGLTFYIFRSSAPQLRSTFFEGGLSFPSLLSEMIEQGHVKINHNEMTIKFSHNGSMIKHRHMSTLNDADDIQGVELAACAVDEASLMPEALLRWMVGRRRVGSLEIPDVVLVDSPDPEKRIMLRDKFPFMLLTSNPGSVSGAFLKKWFIDPAPPMTEFVSDPDFGEDRSIYLPFGMRDNPHLDKDYEKTLLAIGDPVKIRQMRDGDWSAQSATLMGHAFSRYSNIVKAPEKQKELFDIYRSFDHGFSAPAAVVWIGVTKEKTVLTHTDGTQQMFPRGTKVLLSEWYICDAKNTSKGLRYSATEIAKGILEREEKMWGLRVVKPGPADNAIYTMLSESSIGAEMSAAGVRFTKSDKRPGSRALGWARMMELFKRAHAEDIEKPPLVFVEDCIHSIRTVPDLPTDPKKPDDCMSDGEDHLADAIRYAVASEKVNKASIVNVIGL